MSSRAFARKMRVAPSLLAADFARLPDQIAQIEAGGADWLHVDVMDGVFVPNLSFGAKVIETCRSLTKLPLDVHLMVVEPEKYFDAFAKAGASVMTIHVETAPHLHRQIMRIKELGCAAGAVMNPGTPLDSVREVATDLDLLLVMSVNPGFGGQAFIPGVARQDPARARAARLRREHGGARSGRRHQPRYHQRVLARRGRHLRRRQRGVRREGPAAEVRALRALCSETV